MGGEAGPDLAEHSLGVLDETHRHVRLDLVEGPPKVRRDVARDRARGGGLRDEAGRDQRRRRQVGAGLLEVEVGGRGLLLVDEVAADLSSPLGGEVARVEPCVRLGPRGSGLELSELLEEALFLGGFLLGGGLFDGDLDPGLRPGERRRGWCERRGGGDGCRGLGLDDGGWRGGEGRGLGVEPRGQGRVPLEPVDLGHHPQPLGGGLALALLAVEVGELLQGLEVVGEAPEDGLELVARLVDEAVLPEDPALGQVLVDELLVVGGEGAAELQARRARGRRRDDRHRRGRPLEIHVEAAGSVALLLAEPAQLRAVLLVVRLELNEHLENGRGLVEPALGEVGLDHRRVGLGHQHVVPGDPVELDELGQAPDVRGVALDDLLEEGGRAVDLPALDELVDRGLELVEGLVVAALGQVHLPELLPGLLVLRVALEQALEDAPGVVGAFRAEVGLREP